MAKEFKYISPNKEFNQQMGRLLERIECWQECTGSKEAIGFSFNENKDLLIPPTTLIKLFYRLKTWGAINLKWYIPKNLNKPVSEITNPFSQYERLVKYETSDLPIKDLERLKVDNPLEWETRLAQRFSLNNHLRGFKVLINQQKFDKVYQSFKSYIGKQGQELSEAGGWRQRIREWWRKNLNKIIIGVITGLILAFIKSYVF